MKLQRILSALFLASAASAQLLTQGNGNLPACGQSCTILTQAQGTCKAGGSDLTLQDWSCFCQTVWTASNGALTTMCATSCTSTADNAAVRTWYANNCGSDNGASEHAGLPSGTDSSGGSATSSGTSSGTDTGSGSGSSGSAVASAQPSSSGSSSSSTGDGYVDPNRNNCPDWWSCHWQWIVMVIVLAIGLLALGFGGRWLKKRHDRKKDGINGGFNAGITERAPMATNTAHDSYVSGAGDMDTSGRNSPVRTRDAFMPYGYGYTRSDSRLANERGSPLARGVTPVNDLEKDTTLGSSGTPDDPRQKSRRVLVRERSGGADSSDMEKR